MLLPSPSLATLTAARVGRQHYSSRSVASFAHWYSSSRQSTRDGHIHTYTLANRHVKIASSQRLYSTMSDQQQKQPLFSSRTTTTTRSKQRSTSTPQRTMMMAMVMMAEMPAQRGYQQQQHRKNHSSATRRQYRPNYIRDFEVPPDMSRLPPKFGDNQHIDIDAEMRAKLMAVVDTIHHKAPIRYAFAYGSGVFAQQGYDDKNKPMVDFIFGVSHPQHWHSLNLQANPDHYSFLGKFGSKVVATVQERFGAGVYYNPYVEINGMMVKYGVVGIDTLCNDLLNWNTLYLAGRLHKPVKILIDDPRTRLSNQVNLFNATRVSLLMLPKRFTSEELFTKIAGLSYEGDFRMKLGENPHKVRNIVKAQMAQFHRLFDPLLTNLDNVTTLSDGLLEQDEDPMMRSRVFNKLPPNLKKGVLYGYHSALSKRGVEIEKETDQELQSVATAPDLPIYLKKTLHGTIQIPAMSQSAKGILTAGLVKSTRYGSAKMGKWWSGKTK